MLTVPVDDETAAAIAEIDASLAGTFMAAAHLPPALNPYTIAAPLLEMPEHRHLLDGGATIDWLFRTEVKRKQGRFILGTCYMPRVTGDLADLFDYLLERMVGRTPDFLIVLSWDYWRDATARGREILAFHELKHAQQARDLFGAPKFNRMTGAPIWMIQGHDLEEFDDVARRYGVQGPDMERFLHALSEHMETPT